MPINYSADVPQYSQPMNVTQQAILQNFQAIPEFLAVNHISFGLAGAGLHSVLSLQEQETPTTTSTELALCCQATGSPNIAELFIVYPEGATTTTPVQVSIPYTSVATGTAFTGYVLFPSGIKIGYGTIIGNPSSGTTYATIPSFTQGALAVNATATTVNSGWVNAMGLAVQGTGSNWSIYAAKFSTGVTTYNYLVMGL